MSTDTDTQFICNRFPSKSAVNVGGHHKWLRSRYRVFILSDYNYANIGPTLLDISNYDYSAEISID